MELLTKALFGLLRNYGGFVVLWLNQRNILTENESLELMLTLATFAATGIWSVYNKVIALRERNTAAAKPTTSTPAEIKAEVKAGTGAPALTPQNVVPQMSKEPTT